MINRALHLFSCALLIPPVELARPVLIPPVELGSTINVIFYEANTLNSAPGTFFSHVAEQGSVSTPCISVTSGGLIDKYVLHILIMFTKHFLFFLCFSQHGDHCVRL